LLLPAINLTLNKAFIMKSTTAFRSLLGVILIVSFSSPLLAQDIKEKMRLVETGLFPTTQIADSNYRPSTIQQRLKDLHIPGVSVAVINNYKLEWAKGYGMADVAANSAVTPATLFLAGSISKSVNALGVLKLADQKKIDLYKNINDYLKSWKFPEDSFTKDRKVTTANLLSHTAGLSVHGFPGYTPGDSLPTVQQILDGQRPANTEAVRSIFPPGTKFKYSGGGTTISQLMITDLTKKPYEQYMEEEVLRPLNMQNSTYRQPLEKGAWRQYATAYSTNEQPVKGRFHIYPEMAAAGLWTNPTDLSKFIIETQLSYMGKSNKVLSTAMTRTMLTFYIDSSVGMGVFLPEQDGKKFFSHGGADEGFRAFYFGSLEDGYGAVVMVNSDNGNIMGEIMNSIAAVYKWPRLFPVNKRKTVTLPTDSLRQFTGRYYFPTNDSALVEMKDNKLFIRLNNDQPTRAFFTDGRSFFTLDYPSRLSFITNEKNEIELQARGNEILIGKRK
jgi:CubicO group peptidase (beta-lactamase class C family)